MAAIPAVSFPSSRFTPSEAVDHDPAKIIETDGRHPLKSPEKTASPLMGRADFGDAHHWDHLASRYLPQYDLPPWSRPFSSEEAGKWLERLELSIRAWLRVGYRDLADFGAINPAWPLRAFVGLALELRAERDQAA